MTSRRGPSGNRAFAGGSPGPPSVRRRWLRRWSAAPREPASGLPAATRCLWRSSEGEGDGHGTGTGCGEDSRPETGACFGWRRCGVTGLTPYSGAPGCVTGGVRSRAGPRRPAVWPLRPAVWPLRPEVWHRAVASGPMRAEVAGTLWSAVAPCRAQVAEVGRGRGLDLGFAKPPLDGWDAQKTSLRAARIFTAKQLSPEVVRMADFLPWTEPVLQCTLRFHCLSGELGRTGQRSMQLYETRVYLPQPLLRA